MNNPADILKMSKEELVTLYANTLSEQEEVEATIKAVKDELTSRMDTNGEIIGNYSITKANRINFKVTFDEAKELGAVKPAIDNTVLKQLYDKGIEIKHEVTEYLLIKAVKNESN